MTEDHEDSPQRLRERAESTAAAEAFARGEVTLDLDAAGTVEAPPAPSGEVMVVRSLRLPVDLELRIKAVTATLGVGMSELLRLWITEGVERAEAGKQRDPLAELRTISAAAQRALQALQAGKAAA
jgi:hypothetical protein